MGVIPLTLTVLLYLWVAWDLWFLQKNRPMGLVFLFYAAANVALLLASYPRVWK